MSQGPVPPNSPEVVTAEPINSPPPTQIVIKQQSAFSRLWGWIGWSGFMFCMLIVISLMTSRSEYFDTTDGIREKFHSGDELSDEKIAIITISGTIGSGEGYVKHQIDRVREDESVKGVVVRVNSPGGTVTGSDYIFHHLTKLREEKEIPMVVSMGGMAASGGYYVSMAVGELDGAIFAEPTSVTGSIGVIIPHYDVSELMSRYGVKEDSIVTHERKQMLAMTKEIPDDHRAILQDHVDGTLDRFIEVIKSGRPELREGEGLTSGEVDLATGEIFSAPKAKEYGLIDEIGFIEDAIARVCEIQGLSADEVRVVRYSPPVSLFGLSSIKVQQPMTPDGLLKAFENSTPQAYFVCSSLPPLVTSATYGQED